MVRSIDRRTFLRASGVALALPLLETMQPSLLHAATGEAPRRMVNICNTLGIYPEAWLPKQTGAAYETTEYLRIIDRHREHYSLFSNFSHEDQTGRQPHNSEVTFLTAARGPGRDGFKNTISIDQAAANHLGYVTRFPSVTLGTASGQSQSYTANGVMIPAEISPARLFKKMFLAGEPEEVERESRNLASGGSILDRVKAEASALRRRVSSADRVRLDAYYAAVRTAEQELNEAGAWLKRPKPVVALDQPTDIPDKADLIGRIRLLFNMIPLILETDSSRVISIMIQDHGVVPQVQGVNGSHHNLSHHGQDEAKIDQLKKIEARIIGQLDGLLTELRERGDSHGPLLDTTTVLFGSNLGNANSHEPKHLPILVAGGGLSHGKHHRHEGDHDAPLSNLFVTLLQAMGLETDRFGQSTGSLTWS